MNYTLFIRIIIKTYIGYLNLKKISLFICQNGTGRVFFVYQLVNKVNKLLKHCLHLTSDNRRKEVQVKRSRSLSIYDYGHWIRR